MADDKDEHAAARPDTERGIKREKKAGPLAWAIDKALAPLIVAILVFAATRWWDRYEGRIRALEYSTYAAPLPNKHFIVSVSVWNSTDRDFTDVPVSLTFVDEEENPLRLISAVASDGDIETVPQTQPSEWKNAVKLTYVLKVVNRAEQNGFELQPMWTGIYKFECTRAPKVLLSVSAKGLTVTQTTKLVLHAFSSDDLR